MIFWVAGTARIGGDKIVNWSKYVDETAKSLRSLVASDGNGKSLDNEIAFALWNDLTVQVRAQQKTIFLIGNGASASMASHVAADLAKNAHVHTEVFTDLALITAIANDISFEEVFAEPLRRRLRPGDILVAISSSGKSANILSAVQATKKLGGRVITLSAMNADNPLRKEGELNFYIPAQSYGMAETCHAALLHFWIDKIVSATK
ncbi:MAG: SIS domain-containing protein [Verrucomicrobia bacterium]|nr:SIS domain-containing protein [Verrucomicrobiota bacterium]